MNNLTQIQSDIEQNISKKEKKIISSFCMHIGTDMASLKREDTTYMFKILEHVLSGHILGAKKY